jgi:phage replication-related protein YjqB (UPF0714/DUF867 family)
MRILLLIFMISICSPALAQKISSYKELATKKIEGKDFDIKTRSGPSSSLVMAIHGGTIEPGTTELADAIAADRFSFYSFTGLVDDYQGLHLTSTDFDEPRLAELTQNAKNCLSVHGLKNDAADFCVGGANADKRKAYVKLLAKKFPKWRSCELCCPPNSGTSKNNVVNRCKLAGVQIEMGQGVRSELKQNLAFLKELASVLRDELDKD